MTTCPRCAHETIEVLASSPVPGVRDVVQCAHCLYTWRTTEPTRRTTPAAYPEMFRLTQQDIDAAVSSPPCRRSSPGNEAPVSASAMSTAQSARAAQRA